MTNTKVTCIIVGVVTICVTMAMVFVFGSSGVRRNGKCSITMFIPPDYFTYFDIPILSITSLIMFYSFYRYYKMARKTQPEGSGQNGVNKAQIKVTRTMLTVVVVFLTSNIIWYSVFFIIDGLELEGFAISLLYWLADGLWLVSTHIKTVV